MLDIGLIPARHANAYRGRGLLASVAVLAGAVNARAQARVAFVGGVHYYLVDKRVSGSALHVFRKIGVVRVAVIVGDEVEYGERLDRIRTLLVGRGKPYAHDGYIGAYPGLCVRSAVIDREIERKHARYRGLHGIAEL